MMDVGKRRPQLPQVADQGRNTISHAEIERHEMERALLGTLGLCHRLRDLLVLFSR
jgi:hypothetical protein